jgi:hypothetical protein
MLAVISTGARQMTRLTAADLDPEVSRLFDGHVHGRVSRRTMAFFKAKLA